MDNEEKFVQAERGPLGRGYEWLRTKVADNVSDTEKTHEGKYVQPRKGPLPRLVEKLRALLFGTDGEN